MYFQNKELNVVSDISVKKSHRPGQITDRITVADTCFSSESDKNKYIIHYLNRITFVGDYLIVEPQQHFAPILANFSLYRSLNKGLVAVYD